MSDAWQQKKSLFDGMLTIYGRKPVLEALQDKNMSIFRLHLAESNRSGGIISEITTLAEQRGVEIQWHSRLALSRISRNGKQDQGVAADLQLKSYLSIEELASRAQYKVIALDGVTNPQNVGMIIRSVAASPCSGLLLPKRGCAALSPLVIKASAGAIFKADLWYCETIEAGLETLKKSGATICTLSSHARTSLYDYSPASKNVWVLGNETEGVSKPVEQLCNKRLNIPMQNGVESLNVAVTAALVAFSLGAADSSD